MGLFSFAKKFSDTFFDGLSTKTTDKALKNARKNRLKEDAIRKEQQKKRDEEELQKILKGDY